MSEGEVLVVVWMLMVAVLEYTTGELDPKAMEAS